MRTLPIFLAFFLMGLADAMGPNADRVKNAYQLSNVMSTMLPFVVFIALRCSASRAGCWPRASARRNC